jgi:hypothetical protein
MYARPSLSYAQVLNLDAMYNHTNTTEGKWCIAGQLDL